MVTNDIYKKKLDWQKILRDIKAAGLSLYEVAKRLGKPESTIQSWWKGHEPSHSHGQAILELHTKCCGEEATRNRCNEEVVYSEQK